MTERIADVLGWDGEYLPVFDEVDQVVKDYEVVGSDH